MKLMIAPKSGQSVVEYGLVGSVVLIAIVGVLWSMSGNLDRLFGGLDQDMENKAQAASVVNGLKVGVAGQISKMNAAGAETLVLTLKDGTKIQIPNYPTNAKMTVQTIGANGMTASLALTLDTLIAQLEQANRLTPAQISALKDLANTGHTIAQIQQLMEMAANNATDVNAFENTQMVFNGKTYTPEELHYEIGFWSTNPSSLSEADILRGQGAPEGYTKTLLSQLQAAQASGALSDPAVADVVKTLVAQIALSGEITQDAAYRITFLGASLDTFASRQLSNATHVDSIGICTQGQGTDSGVQCQ